MLFLFPLTFFLIEILQALSVLILYVRCTAIDPADPGILIEADEGSACKLQNDTDMPGKCPMTLWSSYNF